MAPALLQAKSSRLVKEGKVLPDLVDLKEPEHVLRVAARVRALDPYPKESDVLEVLAPLEEVVGAALEQTHKFLAPRPRCGGQRGLVPLEVADPNAEAVVARVRCELRLKVDAILMGGGESEGVRLRGGGGRFF